MNKAAGFPIPVREGGRNEKNSFVKLPVRYLVKIPDFGRPATVAIIAGIV